MTHIPADAIDTHVHVFDPARFPYAAERSYTPGAATLADLRRFEAGLGVGRVVLVQPSPYGDDNRCMLDALAALGPARARGIAVVRPDTITDAQVEALRAAGVVGVRANLTARGIDRAAAAVDSVAALVRRLGDTGLAIQVYADCALIAAMAPTIAASPVPFILDHFAGVDAALGPEQPGLAAVLRLLDSGKVWIKWSGAYRASAAAPAYRDLAPIARRMARVNPDRLVWASDWPHTGGGAARRARDVAQVEPFRTVDDARLLDIVSGWAGGAAARRRLLVDNPAALFRF